LILPRFPASPLLAVQPTARFGPQRLIIGTVVDKWGLNRTLAACFAGKRTQDVDRPNWRGSLSSKFAEESLNALWTSESVPPWEV
jgi:hypothetical protein